MARTLTDIVDKKLKTPSTVSVTGYPVNSNTSSTTDASTFKGQTHDSVIIPSQPNQKLTHRSRNVDKAKSLRCPKPTLWVKTKEVARLSQIKLKVQIRDLKEPWQPLSEVQQAIHSHIGPLLKRGGIDDRVLLGSGNSSVEVEHDQGGIQTVIHAGNHNYAGLYKMTEETERLHQLCLDSLPVSVAVDSTNLESALQAKVAQFFDTDFCCVTSTGYASNILAFTAILDKSWVLILDENCHNSMHVGAYLSAVGRIVKYRHNDMIHLQSILVKEQCQWKNIMVAVEGLYSMEGTTPDLGELAQLKAQYNFTLLADEAHSFGSLGRTGRGCIESWNDQKNGLQASEDLFDIRTAVLSKAFGAIGGVVCGKAQFASCVQERREQLYAQGMEKLTPSAMMQALHNLSQPAKLRRKLERLHAINSFMCEELFRTGMFVYGGGKTPIMPIHTGRPSIVFKFAYVLRTKGVIANPIVPPAVPFWQTRIRVALSADWTDTAVNKLLEALKETASSCGIISGTTSVAGEFVTDPYVASHEEEQEVNDSFDNISKLIKDDAAIFEHDPRPSERFIAAGHIARRQYGFSAGAPRWGSGTYKSHVDAERAIYTLTGQEGALLYSDTYLGLLSTMTALCRPILGYAKHTLFVPSNVCQAVLDGLKAAPRKHAPQMQYYDDMNALSIGLTKIANSKTYSTVYFDGSTGRSKKMLIRLLASFTRSGKKYGLSLLLHDSQAPGTRLQKAVATAAKGCGVELLLFGSFANSICLPGAYLSGNRDMIGELRYTSRAYMFTSSQLPFIGTMVAESLEELRRNIPEREDD